MPQYLVSHAGGWAEVEWAESPEQARKNFIQGCRAVADQVDDGVNPYDLGSSSERARFDDGIHTIKVKEYNPNEGYCVCGVHRSEHQLCGCGDFATIYEGR